MVEVIPFTLTEDEYDGNRIVERKGDRVVSHGIDINTGKTVTLPCEPFDDFVIEHCRLYEGIWILK